jgi:hypothetical protein
VSDILDRRRKTKRRRGEPKPGPQLKPGEGEEKVKRNGKTYEVPPRPSKIIICQWYRYVFF